MLNSGHRCKPFLKHQWHQREPQTPQHENGFWKIEMASVQFTLFYRWISHSQLWWIAFFFKKKKNWNNLNIRQPNHEWIHKFNLAALPYQPVTLILEYNFLHHPFVFPLDKIYIINFHFLLYWNTFFSKNVKTCHVGTGTHIFLL